MFYLNTASEIFSKSGHDNLKYLSTTMVDQQGKMLVSKYFRLAKVSSVMVSLFVYLHVRGEEWGKDGMLPVSLVLKSKYIY